MNPTLLKALLALLPVLVSGAALLLARPRPMGPSMALSAGKLGELAQPFALVIWKALGRFVAENPDDEHRNRLVLSASLLMTAAPKSAEAAIHS
jgi:hypothetical protein